MIALWTTKISSLFFADYLDTRLRRIFTQGNPVPSMGKITITREFVLALKGSKGRLSWEAMGLNKSTYHLWDQETKKSGRAWTRCRHCRG